MEPGQPLRWLGGQIDVAVRISSGFTPEEVSVWDVALWNQDVWGAEDFTFQDVSDWVEEVSYQRGAETWDSRFTAGTGTVRLNNQTGMFTPISDAPQPWGKPFKPGHKVQISVLPDPDDPSFRVALFSGRIDERTDEFDEAGAALTTVITLIDALAELGMNNPPALEIPTGVQTTDERIISVLDNALVPSEDRDIQTGVHNMASSQLAQTSLEEAQRAADSEGGAFFSDPDGKLVFKARDWLSTDPRSIEIQGYLGFEVSPDPGVPEAQIVSGSVATNESLARIRNDVQFARDGGNLQWVFDTDSMQEVGIRSYSRTDYNNATDAEVLWLAERHLEVYKESRLRVQSVGIQANADPDNESLNRLFYETRFGDLLALEVRTLEGWRIPMTLTHVIGIAGRITAEDWSVNFTLDDSLIGAI